MKLTKVRIQNYRCINDSEEFSIDQMNCLVGKNEAGKSSILKALYKLKPDVSSESKFDPIIDYPRSRYSEYKERHNQNPDNVLSTTWQLDDIDIEAVEDKYGKDVLDSNIITVSKGYDNTVYWSIDLNEKKVLGNLVDESELFSTSKTPVKSKNTIREAITYLENKSERTEPETNLLSALNQEFSETKPNQKVIAILSKNLPTFLYFADYYKMQGLVSIDDLKQRQDEGTLEMGHRIFNALLKMVGTSADEINEIGRSEELIAELEAVSSRLSHEIFQYWSQNKYLQVKFLFYTGREADPEPFNSGYIFHTRIENTRHGVSVSFDERSAGFVWFFSFLVWFSQVRRNYGKNLVILLDDPGLSLHARAQADLLRYIRDKLMPNHQILYSTHSPFLVDPDHLMNIRTVEDVLTKELELLGTKVSDDVLSIDPDTIFPLQAALGYDITQSLFIGKDNLLVEGPSDLLYLKFFSSVLQAKGREYLDSRWVIVPCGGIGKVSPFMSLFGSNSLNIAVFCDWHTGIKGKVRSLTENRILEASQIITTHSVLGANSDVEDMLGRVFYISLINECYNLDADNKLPLRKPSKAPKRVIQEVSNHLEKLGIGYDHYKPASYLMSNEELLSKLPKTDKALDNFEKLFALLTPLLP